MVLRNDGRPRVVVTGIGIISSLGLGIQRYWAALKRGASGIRHITSFDPSHLQVQIAGEVIDFEPADYLTKKDVRRLERASQFAVAATQMALADAGFSPDELEANAERTGVVMGSAFAGYDAWKRDIVETITNNGRLGPFSVIASLINLPTFYVAHTSQAVGPANSITTACAAGTQAIGEGLEMIRRRHADIVLAGGVEALIKDYAIAGFDAMKVLVRGYNDDPAAASRPFDADRAGFVYGEGCAVLVMESLAHARQRGARCYAEVKGHSSSNSAYHVAALDPGGQGAQRAMRWALDDSGLNPDDIDYVNAHGTGTKANDCTETYAIRQVFGYHADHLAVSSTKSMVGHVLGGAGAVEAAACAMTLHDQVIHPTINYTTPDPECNLDYVPNIARDARVRNVLSNSFGLGSQNACLVFGQIT